MATSLASPVSSETIRSDRYRRERRSAAWLATVLTPLAVAVHGYHPYAEDGGVYLPEIKRLLHPDLYPQRAEYVVGHLQFSIFAPVMAALARASHLSVESTLFLVHLASFWLTLFAAWLLAARCFRSQQARAGAVTLLATWITLPIAGTSLMLMDPYVTARSISTPCALFALVGALEFILPANETNEERRRGLVLCLTALVIATSMHPLMGAYATGSVLVLMCTLSKSRLVRTWGTAALCITAVAVAGALQLAATPESEAYRSVVITRYYWFLSQWHSYEVMGLIAPLAILAVTAFRQPKSPSDLKDEALTGLTRMAAFCGATAVLVALLFAHAGFASHIVARLQPLRIFQLIYIVMILTVGATLAERFLQRSATRWVITFSLLACIMAFADRQTFPASAHLELPGTHAHSENSWEQAFLWIKRNTPKDAVFALDAHYITRPGEDAQGFRGIAERSSLPDYSKDGGVVTNKPFLSDEWMAGQTAQTGLNSEKDADRIASLKPLGATWIILDRHAKTAFPCDYANDVVKVCRLTETNPNNLRLITLQKKGAGD